MSIKLGERQRSVESIAGYKDRFRELRLPLSADLLGCHTFHEASGTIEDAIVSGISETLRKTSLEAHDIDALILTSTDPGIFSDRQLLPRVMERAALRCALPMVVTGQECTGLLGSISVAHQRLAGGRQGSVLVVSCDRTEAVDTGEVGW